MSAFESMIAPAKEKVQLFLKSLRRRILGNNNEALDRVIDGFYRLSPDQRAGVIIGGSITGVVAVLAALWLYFSTVAALENNLNSSFNALHELRSLKREYDAQQGRFTKLVGSVNSVSGSLRVKPFFEEKAQALGIEMQGLADKTVPISSDNPLSQKLQYVNVEMRLPKISIPRLLNFLTEVEKSGQYLTVQNLVIRSRYGTKLFFDVDVEFRAYASTGGGVANSIQEF